MLLLTLKKLRSVILKLPSMVVVVLGVDEHCRVFFLRSESHILVTIEEELGLNT